jgi:hypothetical protein
MNKQCTPFDEISHLSKSRLAMRKAGLVSATCENEAQVFSYRKKAIQTAVRDSHLQCKTRIEEDQIVNLIEDAMDEFDKGRRGLRLVSQVEELRIGQEASHG